MSEKTIRESHLNQLLSYIIWAEDSGVYYGNKKYFDKRHLELKQWVNDMIDEGGE